MCVSEMPKIYRTIFTSKILSCVYRVRKMLTHINTSEIFVAQRHVYTFGVQMCICALLNMEDLHNMLS